VILDYLQARGPYLLYAALLVLGLYLLLTHRNLLKAMVGLSVVQSGTILFFILLSVRKDATLPILMREGRVPLDNPLPHALMLTAIVVGVSTLGVGLAILRRLQAEEGAIEDRPAQEER
jgi:multicomponent Na+:H+ antiporter subunit C